MLENFRSQTLIWDKANKNIFEKVKASQGDSNGRKLRIQVLNDGVVEDLSGSSLSLAWKSRQGTKGMDAFKVVDAAKGLYEIYYTTGMLSNKGNLRASLVLVDPKGRIESDTFTIELLRSNVDDDSVQSQNSFTALTTALVKIDGFASQLAEKATKGDIGLSDLNKNKLKLDGTWFEDSFLEDLSNNEINTTYLEDESVTNKKIAKKAVDLYQTNFSDKSSKNIFDGIYTDGLLAVRALGGSSKLYPVNNYNDLQGKTAVVPIESNKTYTVSLPEGGNNHLRIGITNGYPSFIDNNSTSTENPVDTTIFYPANSTRDIYTFQNTAEGRYALIYVSNEGVEPKLQVEEGNVATSYDVPYTIQPEVMGETGEYAKKLKEITIPSPNLFDGNYIEGVILHLNPDGTNEEILYARRFSNGGASAVIEIEPNETYTVKVHDDSQFRTLRIGIMNEYPTFPDSFDEPVDTTILYSSNRKEYTFKNTAEGKYAIIYPGFSGFRPRIQFEKGEIATPYKEYDDVIIDNNALNIFKLLNDYTVNKNYHFNFYRDLNRLYRSPELEGYWNSPSTVTTAQYNQELQDLIDRHPEAGDYATYELAGTDDWGNELYRYELNPSTYYIDNTRQEGHSDVSDGVPMKKPKVVLVGAIHGRERTPVYALYYIVKAILEREDNELIKFIREHVHLVFIPISNPTGFDKTAYTNDNGVNLNRDFLPAGTGAQKEVQIVTDMINDNSDADLFIDLHTKFDFTWDGYLGWSYTENEVLKNTINLMFQSIGQEWQAENPELPQDWNYVWSYNAPSTDGTSERYAKLNEIDGTVVLECSWKLDGIDTVTFGESATRMSKELIINTITGYLRTKFID